MARARTLTLKTQVEVTGADKLDNLGRKFQKAGAALTVGITTPLLLLGGAAGRAASDLNESMNAVNVTFGETAEAINKIGATSADSFGLSQRAFNEVATRFSAFASTVAGEGGDVARVIEDLTRRGSDFASVFNLDVDEALSLFQSGLAGETEPLRKFGIDLSAAAVEAHAMATGIADGTGELTEAQKVQARYSLLMQQTSKVQGDFANTSTEVANAQRIAAARAEDAAAKLGQKFLPIQQKVIEVLTDAIDAWSSLPAPMQDAIVIFGVAAAALGPLLLAVGTFMRAGTALIALAPRIGAAFHTMLGPIGLAVGALAALTAAGTEVHKALDPVGHRFNELASQVGASRVEIEGEVNRLAQDLGVSAEEIRERLSGLLESGIDWDRAVRAVADGAEGMTQPVKDAAITWAEEMAKIQDSAINGGTAAADGMATELGQAPQKMADALLANQFHLTGPDGAIQELIDFMDQALTPAEEVFNARMFLASQAAADGLASNNPLVRTKTEEMVAEARAVLAAFGKEAFNYGFNFSGQYAAGVVNNLGVVKDAGRQLGGALAQQVRIESEPPDHNSPLYGITKWGGNLVKTFAEGILSGLPSLSAASRTMAGAVGFGGVASVVPVAGGSGGTNITNIYLQWDGEPPKGRDEAEIVANLQRLMPLAGGKLAPGYG